MANDHFYSEYADAVDGVLRYVCRHNRLSADDCEEFSSVVRLKLLLDDCAILREFKGNSSLKTFLVIVIQRVFLDWRNANWGKWRPSAEAIRLGALAIELERLVLRDGMDYEQAAQWLVSKGISKSMAECDEVWSRLKRASRKHFVSTDNVDVPDIERLDPIEEEERGRVRAIAKAALKRAISEMVPLDRLLLRLRYYDGLMVATIARSQELEQKPLYRRFEEIEQRLGKALLAANLSEDQIRSILGDLGDDFDIFEDEDGK